jgi:hypothetical protein
VDAADLNSLGVNWQQSTPIAAAVPEPDAIGFVTSALLLIIPQLRRRR